MIQTFYILQNSYNNSKLKRINGFDHKKAFWYQSMIILFLYEIIGPINYRILSYLSIFMIFVIALSAENLCAIAHLGAVDVNPSLFCKFKSFTLYVLGRMDSYIKQV